MSKSYVTMEQNICMVCGKEFDTGAILLDRKMRDKFEHKTTTGAGICPEHQKLHDDGYIALIGVDTANSILIDGLVKPGNAHRTGKIAFFKRTVAKDVLNVSPEVLKSVYLFIDDKALDLMDPGVEIPSDLSIN